MLAETRREEERAMTHRQAGVRVLVVDDEDTRRGLELVLRTEGFVVQATSDATNALEMATRSAPAIVLLGVGMSGCLELLGALRAREIPVIVVGVVAELATAIAAIRAGAADYLTKPVDAGALLLAIGRAVEAQSLRGEVVMLRERLRMQQELFSLVAHDVRSHLATVAMVMSSFAREALPGHERKVALVQRAVKRVEGLVDDLLDLTRLQAGVLRLPLAIEHSSMIVEEAVVRIQRSAADRAVTVAASGDDFTLCCDRVRIVKALEHLGSIAVQMTPRDGVVRLRVEVDEGRGLFVIEAGGPGIPKEEAPGRPCGFAGLGLAVAKAIVTAHGGSLEVDNGTHGGTRFVFAPALEPSTGARIVAGQEITAASS
jgi:signal transduction histidine kinase